MGNGHDEGTITLWFGHEHPDWVSNKDTYNFGPFGVPGAGAEVGIVKEPDGVLYFTIVVHGRTFRHEQLAASIGTTPATEGGITHAMFFALRWSPKIVDLTLAGTIPAKKVVTFRV